MSAPDPSQSPAFPTPNTAFLDALRSHIALLDEQGRVVWVNRAWRKFGQENQATDDSVGRSYEQICASASGPGAEDAGAMLAGLAAIRRQALDSFTRAYDCSSPTEHRIFQAQLTDTRIEGRRVFVLSHDSITRAIDDSQTAARLAALSDPGNPTAIAAALGGMLHHELSAPLTSLICMLSGARHLLDHPNADPAALRPLLAEAIAQADHARATSVALRSLTAQPPTPAAAADLAVLAAAICESVGDDARARSVRVRSELQPAPTETDPARAALMLLALARAAIRDAGSRPITERTVHIRSGVDHAAWVSVSAPLAREGQAVSAASCATVPDPFGPDFVARTAEQLGGSVVRSEGTVRVELPLLRRRAA